MIITNVNKLQNDNHCKLYLPFKSSVTSEDSKGKSETHTVTNNGSVAITTVGGRECASFDGATQYLSIPSSVDLNFGNRDSTIYFEINFTEISAQDGMFRCPVFFYDGGTTSNSGGVFLINSTSGDMIAYFANDAVGTITNMDDGTWHDICLVRNNNYMYLFKDGSQKDVSYITRNITTSLGNASLHIGARGDDLKGKFQGYIRNMSAHRGIARFTKNFTSFNRLI